MMPVGECRVDVRIESACCSIGIALNTRYLHQSAHWVARHTQMVLKSHFGGIFNLCRAAAKQLAGGCGCHGTCHPDFGLASGLGS